MMRVRKLHSNQWTPTQDATLCDGLSEGLSFAAVGRQMGKTKDSCVARFDEIKKKMGCQAC